MSGLAASARATATRWRWPPDSSRGHRAPTAAGSRPTSPSARSAQRGRVGEPAQPGHQRHVAPHAPVRQQPAVLRARSPRGGAARPGSTRATSSPSTQHLAAVRIGQPVEAAEQRGLARAALADERDALAAAHLERHAVERHDGAVPLGDLPGRERDRLVHRGNIPGPEGCRQSVPARPADGFRSRKLRGRNCPQSWPRKGSRALDRPGA